MEKTKSKQVFWIFIVLLAGLNFFLFNSILFQAEEIAFIDAKKFQTSEGTPTPAEELDVEEFVELETHDIASMSGVDVTNFFAELSRTKGAPYAYNLLKIADIKPGVDIHLLAHVIGDELYIQEKLDGIKHCTHHFQNACSHTIVIGHMLEFGEAGTDDLYDVCSQAPGGKGAYTQCFHGLGHGVLAFYDYQMEPAVKLCKQFGTDERNHREYIECVGGMTMEMMLGVHNLDLWNEVKGDYLSEIDPLSPCNMSFMPLDARPMCYVYLTPRLFEFQGNIISKTDKSLYKTIIDQCDGIPLSEEKSRNSCFGGFGKEFIAVVKDKDIRSYDTATVEEFAQVYEWCSLIDDRKYVAACMETALASLYWGGENSQSIPVRFCKGVSDQEHQDQCFDSLTNAVSYYRDDGEYRQEYCGEIPLKYYSQCKEKLL